MANPNPASHAAPHRPSGANPEGYQGPRRSLILAGGGMRVAYQAGVLRALVESGLSFAHADGTSGGIINLAMLLSGMTPTAMCDRWRTLPVKDFVSFQPLSRYVNSSNLPALGTADGVVNKVFPHLGIDTARINSAVGIEGTFNVCNFTRKTIESIPHDRVDVDDLVAGTSLPIFLPPVRKGESLFTDAVWIKDANLMEAVRRGAEELWVVWMINNTGEYKNGFFNQYVHMIEMSANGALFEEFDRINTINDLIRSGTPIGGRTRPIRLHLIRPEYPLGLDPSLYFGEIDTATLVDLGYADGWAYLRGMTEEGLAFDPVVTKMRAGALGLTFRELMTGGFALGETDPEAGEKKGQGSACSMSMHATIAIQDLKRFVADRDHAGGITGHISFTPFGENITAKRGVFNLFIPSDQPDLKLMIYELAFEHDGQDYYLQGFKKVAHQSMLHVWHDTTTLYCRLHEGTDNNGPVVGAGVLHLGVAEFIKMGATMHALNASSALEAVEAQALFGKFFMGQLWDTYGPK